MTDNFWGDTQSTGEVDMGGGDFEPIPANTQVLATADEALWKEFEGSPAFINIKWTVMAPEEYKNRVIFQKIRVMDPDPSKAQRHKNILAAIDMNASGGKLLSSGQAPTDDNMAMTLCHKPMYLKLQIWKMNDKEGNWVCAVSPKDGNVEVKPETKTDDDVPF